MNLNFFLCLTIISVKICSEQELILAYFYGVYVGKFPKKKKCFQTGDGPIKKWTLSTVSFKICHDLKFF